MRATHYCGSEPPNILVQSHRPPCLLTGGPERAFHLDNNPPFLFGSRALRTLIVPIGVYSERVVDDYVHAYVGHRRCPLFSSASFRLDCWQRLQLRVGFGLLV